MGPFDPGELPESMLNAIPPAVLLILNTAIVWSVGRRSRDMPHGRLALVCAIGPLLYGLGMLLFLLNDRWTPGVAVGAIGTLAVPAAVAMTLFPSKRVRVACVVIAIAVWSAVWLTPRPAELWSLYASQLCYALYMAVMLLLAGFGLSRELKQGRAGGLERRIFVLCLPFFLMGLIYMLVRGTTATEEVKPILSTCVHVGAEIVLLMLVGQEDPETVDLPSTLPALLLQGLLLAVGALLLLVLAANLQLFPKAPIPLIVAAIVAMALALGYGIVRPTLDVLLQEALYPEAHAAEQRLLALQNELDSAKDRLRQAEHLSLVGQLAAQVAHEIKNPLGPIKGYTKVIERETLKAGALNDTVQRGIEIIRQEVESIDARARGLLELARPPSPQTEDVDFVSIGQDVIDLLSGELPPNVQLRWATHPDTAPGRGDPLLLRSALTNVVQNATQILGDADGGVITLTLRSTPEGFELLVDDDGPGLPTDDPESLFRPFVSHRPGGNGLGLVISRGSIRAMGGDLELQPREPNGTRAVFRLPSSPTPSSPEPQEATAT